MLKSIYTKERREKIPRTVMSGVYRPLTVNDSGVVTEKCAHCGDSLYFKLGEDTFEVIEAACGNPKNCNQQLNWKERFPLLRLAKVVAESGSDREPCDECGGKPWRRGHKHLESCSKHPDNIAAAREDKVKEPCPDCGGPPGRTKGYKHLPTCPRLPANKPCPGCGGPRVVDGKGWVHKDDCPRLSEDRESCPECGGPPGRARGYKHLLTCLSLPANKPCPDCGGSRVINGRGWVHKDDCPRSPKDRELANKKREPKSSCKECGGPSRGRGFTHTGDCSLNSRNKVNILKSKVPRFCEHCGGPARGCGFTHNPDCPDHANNKPKIEASGMIVRRPRRRRQIPVGAR